MAKLKVPNTYVIIFFVIVLCAVATWFVPSGEYLSTNEGMIYHTTDARPQTWQIFSAIFKGFSQQAGIIAFVLIIGGAFWVVNSTKAVENGISRFISRVSRLEDYTFFRKAGVGNIVIVLVMLLFGVFGAVFGMSEETIAFAAIVVPLAISLGYDSIVGVCMVYVSAHVGFAGAMLNPFTVGIAQEMSSVALFSGIGYRTLCWAVLMLIAIAFVLAYAAKVKKNPASSIMYEADVHWRKAEDSQTFNEEKALAGKPAWFVFCLTSLALLLFSVFYASECTINIGGVSKEVPWLLWAASGLYILVSLPVLCHGSEMYILNMLLFCILFLVIGVMGFGWYIGEITALFFALAIASGIAAGYTPDRIVQEFLSGAKDIFSAAMVIGFAAGIIVILKDGQIIDTILHSLAGSLDGSGKVGAVASMYGIQSLINIFIPSATAKAAITMPIMAPFSDLIGVSRQLTVLAFQFGDGFTNMITPCSGVLLAVLSVARIPYEKWVRWVWKFIIALLVIGFLLLLPPLFFSFAGF